MDHIEFIERAKGTESHVETLKINRHYLSVVTLMFVEVAEMLDGIKKQAFYGDSEKLLKELSRRLSNINEMSGTLAQILAAQGKEGLLNEEHVDYLDTRICHAIIGIMTESGELGTALHDALENKRFDTVNVMEEFFDGDWYKAIGTDAIGGDWSEQWDRIIKKLELRHGKKFSKEGAKKRDAEAERKILEGKS